MKEETRVVLLFIERICLYALSTVRRMLQGKIRLEDGKLREG